MPVFVCFKYNNQFPKILGKMFKCRNIWVLIQLGQLKKGECWQNMNEAENESGFVELREILGVNTLLVEIVSTRKNRS